MDSQMLVVIAVAALAVVLLAWWYMQSRRRAHLRMRFGPEYERAVQEAGSASKAEAMLADRERRVEKLHLRPLTAEESGRFLTAWHDIQTQFVDDPKSAVAKADTLITEVMSVRGYPMATWEQRVADISVDHPRVVERYRIGHDVALRHERGEASTEDLRRAMIAYRELFAELAEPTREPLRKTG